MSTIKPPQKILFTTPFGETRWAQTIEPDTKYKAEGEYSVRNRYDAAAAEPIKKELEKALAAAMEHYKQQLPKAKADKLKESPHSPLKVEEDKDTGEETGNYIFVAKSKASGTRKDGTQWARKVPIKDSRGNPVPATQRIGGGSTVRLNVELQGYYTPASNEVGVSAKLAAIQIKKLQMGSFDSFDDVSDDDDGFVADASGDFSAGGAPSTGGAANVDF